MDHATLDTMHTEGMERATTVFQALENTQPPFTPADAFKCVCSMKCSEILTRTHNAFPEDLTEMITIISDFMAGTIQSVETTGVNGTIEEGARCNAEIDKLYPHVEDAEPIEATIRMHMFDGLLVLIAAKFNRQNETSEDIAKLQKAMSDVLLARIMRIAGVAFNAG